MRLTSRSVEWCSEQLKVQNPCLISFPAVEIASPYQLIGPPRRDTGERCCSWSTSRGDPTADEAERNRLQRKSG